MISSLLKQRPAGAGRWQEEKQKEKKMKKSVFIALVSVVAIGAQAGVVPLDSTWGLYGVDHAISGESSSGFTHTLDLTVGGANRAVYQSVAAGDFSSTAFAVGDTATLSFAVTADSTVPFTPSLSESFRFSICDEDTGDGVSGGFDYGDPGTGNTAFLGIYKAFQANYSRIGSTQSGGKVTTTDQPSNLLDGQGASVDVVLSITRDADQTFSYSLKYDDLVVSTSYTDVNMFMDSVDRIGIRLNDKAANKYAVSNVQLEVIPEPATFGLFSLLGGALIGIRRFFTA